MLEDIPSRALVFFRHGCSSLQTNFYMFQTKCENYLPEDNCSCMFGDIEVKVDKVKVKQGYTVRLLTLKVGKVNKVKVKQGYTVRLLTLKVGKVDKVKVKQGYTVCQTFDIKGG